MLLQVGDDLEQPFGLGERQARGRLVHDDDARVERERLGDLHHLLLGDRQVLDHVARAEIDAEALEQRRSPWRASALCRPDSSRPPQLGSRPMNTLAATSRFSNRLSSWWTKAMPACLRSVHRQRRVLDAVDHDRPAVGASRRPGSSSASTCRRRSRRSGPAPHRG